MLVFDDSGVPVLIKKMGDRYPKPFHPGRPSRKKTLAKQRKMIKLSRQETRELSARQRKALDRYVELGLDPAKKRAAAEGAGYPVKYAAQAMNRILDYPPVHKRIVDALEKAGVTDDRIAEVIFEGLDAVHPFRPEQKDYATIEKFARQANQLRENFPETRIRMSKDTRQIVITMNIDDADSYKRYLALRGGSQPALPAPGGSDGQ